MSNALADFRSLPDRLEKLGPLVKNGADKADEYACRIIALLEEIRDATQTLYGADSFEYPRLPYTAAGSKVVEGREGYVKVIKQIAVTAAAAVDVDLFVGDPDTGFLYRLALAAAGRDSELLDLPTPEGVPIYVVASAAAQVNLVIQRIKL